MAYWVYNIGDSSKTLSQIANELGVEPLQLLNANNLGNVNNIDTNTSINELIKNNIIDSSCTTLFYPCIYTGGVNISDYNLNFEGVDTNKTKKVDDYESYIDELSEFDAIKQGDINGWFAKEQEKGFYETIIDANGNEIEVAYRTNPTNAKSTFSSNTKSKLNIATNNILSRGFNSVGASDGGGSSGYGSAFARSCYIEVNGNIQFFPGFPESVSDSNSANYSAINILGRSEPLQMYVGSGPRTVSVSYKMHMEMADNIEDLVDLVESACYPNYNGSIAAPKCILVIGDTIRIQGVVTNVTANWSETIHTNKLDVVDLSFSVTEVTGNPPQQSEIATRGGRR